VRRCLGARDPDVLDHRPACESVLVRGAPGVIASQLQLPLTSRNKVGFRVDAATLEVMQLAHPHEFVELLLRWRKARAAERRRSAPAGSVQLRDLVGYHEIAKLMGVKTQTARVYAVRDKDFPPVVSVVGRTPLRSHKVIGRYLKLREIRGRGVGGRPPRSTAEVS
jgi:hypothetical protein